MDIPPSQIPAQVINCLMSDSSTEKAMHEEYQGSCKYLRPENEKEHRLGCCSWHSLKPRVCRVRSLQCHKMHGIVAAVLLLPLTPLIKQCRAAHCHPPNASPSRQPFSKLPSESNHGIQLNLTNELITHFFQPDITKKHPAIARVEPEMIHPKYQ